MCIVQNRYDQAGSSQDYHKFFICTHKHPPFRKTRNGCVAALSAAWASILYCHGAVLHIFEQKYRTEVRSGIRPAGRKGKIPHSILITKWWSAIFCRGDFISKMEESNIATPIRALLNAKMWSDQFTFGRSVGYLSVTNSEKK